MEKWKDVYTIEQIKKIQKLELDNLKILIDVCNKLNISFILYGGSLIGAVRHKGFVPWDDDLDIAMMREDYMKFVREAPKLLPDSVTLQSPYDDKKVPYIYTKLRIKGTRCIEYGHHKLDIEQGIYVDIYPIDNMPDSDDELLKNYNRFKRVVKLFVFRQCPYYYHKPENVIQFCKSCVRFIISILLKFIPHHYFIKKIDGIMTEKNSVITKRQGNYSYKEPTNLFYDIQPFEKGEFENISVNLPNNWDRHLSLRYGNYMEMPPEEERIGHKPFILEFGDL